jgi:hypothetical protein
LNALLRRAGVSVRADVKEPADHLSIELALLGRMTRDGASRRDRREFLDLHLLAFTPMFAIKCDDADRTGFYAAAADLMLGFLGAPGGGYGLSYHYGSTGTPTADSPVLLGISEGVSTLHPPIWPIDGVCSAIPVSRIVEMLENPGKPFDFNGVRSSYPDVRLAYWVGGNPFAQHQNRNQMLEA